MKTMRVAIPHRNASATQNLLEAAVARAFTAADGAGTGKGSAHRVRSRPPSFRLVRLAHGIATISPGLYLIGAVLFSLLALFTALSL